MASLMIALIKVYQKCISPVLPRSCRFYPTCSQYAILALQKYGIFKGGFIAIRRIARCHPFHPGGYDPI